MKEVNEKMSNWIYRIIPNKRRVFNYCFLGKRCRYFRALKNKYENDDYEDV